MKDANFLIANGVNVQASLELFGDMQTYNESLNDYLSSIDEKLVNIRKCKETGDMTNYGIYTHSLKSDAKYFGFTKLAEMSYQHELAGKGNDNAFVINHFDELMIEANRVNNLVKQYMGTSPVSFVNQEVPKPDMANAKLILVVDDSDIVRNFIQKAFDKEFVVLLAKDGREAITIIQNNINKLSGLFLDLNMPNVNGFEVLNYLKMNNLFRKIPVSIITGEDSKDNLQRAFTYDIVDVLTKPFNERDIKNVVNKTIHYYE